MRTRLFPLFAALTLTVLFAALSWTGARADTGVPPADGTPAPQTGTPADCAACHQEVYDAWYVGGHSEVQTGHVLGQSSQCLACHKELSQIIGAPTPQNATDDFSASGGQPTCVLCHTTGYDPVTGKWQADGIICQACHSPIPADHPNEPIPVNKMENCKTCHTNERFGWESWQSSAHYQNNMVCSVCHNPHSTTPKLKDGQTDPSSLCLTCHKVEAQDIQHSAHAKAKVTCINCHLGEPTGPDDFHKVPNHSFKPSVDICMNCHKEEMHAKVVVVATNTPLYELPTPLPTAPLPAPATQTQPAPVMNPFQWMSITALIGLAGGVAIVILRRRV